MLKEGDIVYGGAPGQSGFYFDKATLEAANGSRQKIMGKFTSSTS